MGTKSPEAPPAKWPLWKTGGATMLTFVVLLYLIEIVDQLTGHALDRNGIRPLETDGLTGIIFAPLLHADWAHLVANTVPALVLGFLVTLTGMATDPPCPSVTVTVKASLLSASVAPGAAADCRAEVDGV